MLSSRLFRVQLELQTHRAWLQSFRHGITAVATPGPSHPQVQPPARAQFHTSTVHRDDDSFSPKIHRRRPLPQRKNPKEDLPGSLFDDFQAALDRQNYHVAISCYRALEPVEKQALQSAKITRLIRLINSQARDQSRLPPDKRNRDAMDHAFAAAQTITQDIRSRHLPNASGAYASLFNFFSETKQWDAGNKLWAWLRVQEDNELLSPHTCAAAIEMIALQDTSLAELEDMYSEALQRFPDGFASYHLSPGAVVPNREEVFHAQPRARVLLQSIMLARVQRGESKNAYLALDTLLRLDPGTPSKAFQSFLVERPLSEAWTVFLLACRGGVRLPQRDLRTLLVALKSRTNTGGTENAVWALRASLTAIYVFVGSGGALTQNVANEIIITLTQIMRLPGVDTLPIEQRQQLAESLQVVLRKTIALLSRLNATPSIPAFNSIITNIAGYGGLKQNLSTAWKDLTSLKLEPTMVTWRSVLTAAGRLKDVDLIKTSWRSLTEARAAQDQYPDATDAHILAKACLLAGQPELVTAVMLEMVNLTEEDTTRLNDRLREAVLESSAESPSPDFTSDLLNHIENLKRDIDQFEILTQDWPTIVDLSSSFVSLPMHLSSPPADVQIPELEMRNLYGEMTTDPTSPPPASAPDNISLSKLAASRSRTKIPYGTLRYENWKTLNDLLALAERNDRLYEEEVDRAIAAGTSPGGRLEVGGSLTERERVKVGLSELVESGEEGKWVDIGQEQVERRAAKIAALRTPAEA